MVFWSLRTPFLNRFRRNDSLLLKKNEWCSTQRPDLANLLFFLILIRFLAFGLCQWLLSCLLRRKTVILRQRCCILDVMLTQAETAANLKQCNITTWNKNGQGTSCIDFQCQLTELKTVAQILLSRFIHSEATLLSFWLTDFRCSSLRKQRSFHGFLSFRTCLVDWSTAHDKSCREMCAAEQTRRLLDCVKGNQRWSGLHTPRKISSFWMKYFRKLPY